MDTLRLFVLLTCASFSIGDKTQVDYECESYECVGQDTLSEHLIGCLRSMTSSMDVMGVKFNDSNQVCDPLPRSWLDERNITGYDKIYQKRYLDIHVDPPRLICCGQYVSTSYKMILPGEMSPGSSLSFYTSTTQSGARYYFELINDENNRYMKTWIDHIYSRIGIGCLYNGTSACGWQYVSGVQLYSDRLHKFTFLAKFGGGVEVYIDGNFITYYVHDLYPMTPADITSIEHWTYSSYKTTLHRITLEFTSSEL